MIDTGTILRQLYQEREVIDQAIQAMVVVARGGRKPRGRPPGSRNKSKGKGVKGNGQKKSD